MNAQAQSSRLRLHEAALQVPAATLHDAEVCLALAIEHGELPASVKRWATEQWEGKQLPGNINRLETWIAPDDLAAWLARR